MRPSIKILVSGKDITADVTRRAGIVEWADGVDESADAFALTLEDSDNGLEIPKAGVSVELFAGYDGNLSSVGTFYIHETEVSGPPDIMTISGSSAPFIAKGGKSVAARKSKTWEDTTLGSITKSIASAVGMTPVIDSGLASVAVVSEQQTNESDTNFLLRLARRHGGYVKFTQGRLILAKEGTGKGAGGTALNVTLEKRDVSTWRVRAGGKQQSYERVKTRVHDYSTGDTVEKEIEVPKSGSVGEFGVSQAATGTYTPVTFEGPNPYASVSDAESSGKTLAKRLARSSREMSLTLPGRLDIIAGGKITLDDFRPGVKGEWLVKSIRHRIDARAGWTMTITGEGANKDS